MNVKHGLLLLAVSALCPPSGAQAFPSDLRFARAAQLDNLAGMRLGALAARKGVSPEIKAFGKMIVEDHGKAQVALSAIVRKLRIPAVSSLGRRGQQLYDRLVKLTGVDFDRAYRQAMIVDHQASITLYTSESKRGDSPEVRAYATKTLPILKMHLDAIRSVQV